MRCPALSELPPPSGKTGLSRGMRKLFHQEAIQQGWPWTEESEQLPDTMPDGSPWPRVSIVTPSYNQAQFIEETIRSVLLQGYPNLEYIIIDGGSTDESVEIIRKYQVWLAYWISEKDAGQSDGINKGLRRATGEIWAWMNSDDWYEPSAVPDAVNYLNAHPDAGIVYGDCNWVNEAGQLISCQTPPDFDYLKYLAGCNNFIPSGSAFIRASVSRKIGELDTAMHYHMDQDYWLRAGLITRITHISKVLSNFRVYSQAKTWSQSPGRAQDLIRMYEKLFSCTGLPPQVQAAKPRVLARAYLGGANLYYKAGDRNSFRRYLWVSIRTSPLSWSRSRVLSLVRALFGERVEELSKDVFHWVRSLQARNRCQ